MYRIFPVDVGVCYGVLTNPNIPDVVSLSVEHVRYKWVLTQTL